MPICNRCECEFNVETKPGALMFGHPSTVREAVPVWKAHICQECETAIVSEWKRKPITDAPNAPAGKKPRKKVLNEDCWVYGGKETR
jgi:hypothetical protein